MLSELFVKLPSAQFFFQVLKNYLLFAWALFVAETCSLFEYPALLTLLF